jgi:protein-L-isoaspartate(D-aspartate) O-methyltransferase
VLEIGAGTGYNAALMAELVGPNSTIVTVDIDPVVAEQAARLLATNGYGPERVTVIAADGFDGSPDHAPFDRIVATVGCSDLSPRWIEQLAPDGGFALIPLEHGGVHPMMSVSLDPDSGRLLGRVVARSGFIRIQGELDQQGPWPRYDQSQADQSARYPLPARLATLLSDGIRSQDAWEFHYDLALHERRVPWFLTLANPSGGAAHIDPTAAELDVTGEAGPLVDRLLARYDDWRERGSPAATDYESEFVLLDSIAADRDAGPLARSTLDRVKYRQIIRLVER